MSERKEFWLAVGHVSDAARQQLINANCPVLDVSSRPPVVLVGLRRESVSDRFHEDLVLTNMGEIQVRVVDSCQKAITILLYPKLSVMVSLSHLYLLAGVFPAILPFMRTNVR